LSEESDGRCGDERRNGSEQGQGGFEGLVDEMFGEMSTGAWRGEECGDRACGGDDTAASQAGPEGLAGAGKAALHGAEGPLEPFSRLLVGQAFEVAKDDSLAVGLAEACELLEEDGAEVAGDFVRGAGRFIRPRGEVGRRAFPEVELSAAVCDAGGDARGDAIEPGSDAVGPAERGGALDEHEEGGLKRVIEVLGP
jgi:hypothetical protein